MNKKNIFLLGAAALGVYFLVKNAQASTPDEYAAQSTTDAAANPSFFTSAGATQATQEFLSPVQFSQGAQELIDTRMQSGEMQAAYFAQLRDATAQAISKAAKQAAAAPTLSAPSTAQSNYRVDGQIYQAANLSEAIDKSIAATAPKTTGTIVNVGNQQAPAGVVGWNNYSHY